MNLFLYKIILHYGTGGILVNQNGIVIAARREFAWMENLPLKKIVEYVGKKEGSICQSFRFRREINAD